MTLSKLRQHRRPRRRRGRDPHAWGGSPQLLRVTLPACRAHYPGGPQQVVCSVVFPATCSLPEIAAGRRPRRLFDACSGFTRVQPSMAQPPKAAFVTRLRPAWSPRKAARQLSINRQLSGGTFLFGSCPETSSFSAAHAAATSLPKRKLVPSTHIRSGVGSGFAGERHLRRASCHGEWRSPLPNASRSRTGWPALGDGGQDRPMWTALGGQVNKSVATTGVAQ